MARNRRQAAAFALASPLVISALPLRLGLVVLGGEGAMVIGGLVAYGLSGAGVGPVGQLLLVAAMCLVSAWLGWKLHLACD